MIWTFRKTVKNSVGFAKPMEQNLVRYIKSSYYQGLAFSSVYSTKEWGKHKLYQWHNFPKKTVRKLNSNIILIAMTYIFIHYNFMNKKYCKTVLLKFECALKMPHKGLSWPKMSYFRNHVYCPSHNMKYSWSVCVSFKFITYLSKLWNQCKVELFRSHYTSI